MDPKHLNKLALSSLEEREEGLSLGIGELLEKPPYFGWVKLGDFPRYIYMNGKDDGVALRWLWNRNYEKASITAWRSLSDHADLIIDVGAHTGSYSLIASLNEGAKIFAFEPMPMNLGRLVMNLQYNKTNNIKVSPLAISKSGGKVAMDLYGTFGFLKSGQSISYDLLDKKRNQIDSINLNSVLTQINNQGQLLVKIDVEGKEADVLLGANQLLKRRAIFILECINEQSGKQCTDILLAHEYSFYLIDDQLNSISRVSSLKPELVGGKPNNYRLNRLILPSEMSDNFLNIARSLLT